MHCHYIPVGIRVSDPRTGRILRGHARIGEDCRLKCSGAVKIFVARGGRRAGQWKGGRVEQRGGDTVRRGEWRRGEEIQ